MSDFRLLHGDALEQLRTLPDESVQCVVTSPPYWGLRDYGVAGQIGLEPTLPEFISNLVAVFREVRRVLKSDGVAWVNMGDAYAGSRKGGNLNGLSTLGGGLDSQEASKGLTVSRRRDNAIIPRSDVAVPGLKPKDLIGQPWRLAFALQDDGWWLRQDIIWAKPNPMPESIRDRCTKAHEYVFLLSKSERYFYDAGAISEAAVSDNDPGNETHKYSAALADGNEEHRTKGGLVAYAKRRRESRKRGEFNGKTNALPGREAFRAITERRNRRSVWSIASEPYAEAHFATFPTELPRICILAGSRPGDTILDPFNGSGTTGQVAIELGRHYVGCELNPEYIALTEKRLRGATLGLGI